MTTDVVSYSISTLAGGVLTVVTLRVFDLVTVSALGHKPALLSEHSSHRGRSGRHISCKIENIEDIAALYTIERAHLTKSNEQMVDLVVQFRGKPRLEIQPVNLAYEYKPSNV